MPPHHRRTGIQNEAAIRKKKGANPILGMVVTKRPIWENLYDIRKDNESSKKAIGKVVDRSQFTIMNGEFLFAEGDPLRRTIVRKNKRSKVEATGDANAALPFSDFNGYVHQLDDSGSQTNEELAYLMHIRPSGLSRADLGAENSMENNNGEFAVMLAGTHTVENNGLDNFSAGDSFAVLPPPPRGVNYDNWKKGIKPVKGISNSMRGKVVPMTHALVMELEGKVRAKTFDNATNLPKFDAYNAFLTGALSNHADYMLMARVYQAATAFAYVYAKAKGEDVVNICHDLELTKGGSSSSSPVNVRNQFVNFYNEIYAGEVAGTTNNDDVDKAMFSANELLMSSLVDTARVLEVHHRGETLTSGVPGKPMDVYLAK